MQYVASSMTEMKYITLSEVGKEMLWMKQFLHEFDLKWDEYVINCESQSIIDLSKNSMYHVRIEHIEGRFIWLRLVIKNNLMKLEKIHTDIYGSNPTR